MLAVLPAFGQLDLYSKIARANKQFEDKEYHEALVTINYAIDMNYPDEWLYYFRGVIFWNLGDWRSAARDIIKAKQMGYVIKDNGVNYLIDPAYLANEVARGYTEDTLTAENGFKRKLTRKDTLQGGLRGERTCYDVFFYDLRIQVDPKGKKISGSNAIHFKVIESTNRIQIDLFRELNVDSITWNRSKLKFTRDCNAIFVDFPEILPGGAKETVTVAYSGCPLVAKNPPWSGGFVWEKKKGKDWIGVACEHPGASSWWPCKDYIPEKPDSMRITLITNPGYFGISNGNLKSVKKSANSWTYEWFVSYPIINYLVTIYIGDFIDLHETYRNSAGYTIPFDFYVLPHNEKKAREFYSQTRKILEVFEKVYGPYAFPVDGIGMVEAPYTGMEHQGAIAIGDEYGTKKRRSYEEIDYDYLLIHETAHEWFGNAVGMKEMADAWISEGFATYTECLFMEDVYGYDKYMELVISNMKDVINLWPISGKEGVNDNTFLGGDIYHKGALLLHNLRCTLNNDSLFLGLLKSFYRSNIYKNVCTREFISFVNSYTKRDMSSFLKKFLFDKEPPILAYRFILDSAGLILSYRWAEVEENFTMPFLLFDGNGKQFRLTGTAHDQLFKLDGAKTFLIANKVTFPKKILKNSMTYFQTAPEQWPERYEFSSKGKKLAEGYEFLGKRFGIWTEFYLDGKVKKTTCYTDGKLDGRSRTFSEEGKLLSEIWYTNDTMNGKFCVNYENGNPEVSGNYSMGKANGNWEFFTPGGRLAAKGAFDQGSYIQDNWKYFRTQIPTVNPDSVYTSVNLQPHYFGGEDAMYKFVREHLEKKESTSPVKSGTVFISFTVTSNGTLDNFKLERPASKEIAESLICSMKKMPLWAPGYLNDEPVNVKVIIPFKVQ